MAKRKRKQATAAPNTDDLTGFAWSSRSAGYARMMDFSREYIVDIDGVVPPVQFVDDKRSAQKALAALEKAEDDWTAVDSEFDPDTETIATWQFSTGKDRWVIDHEKATRYFLRWLRSDAKKIYSNASADIPVFEANGITIGGKAADTVALDWLVSENRRRHGLKYCALDWLGIPMTDYKDVFFYVPTGKKKRITLNAHEAYAQMTKRFKEYGSLDAYTTIWVFRNHRMILKRLKLWDYYLEHELPFTHTLLKIQPRGVAMDKSILNEIGYELTKTLARVRHLFTEYAPSIGVTRSRLGQEFVETIEPEHINLNSTPQLAALFYDELGCKTVRKVRGKLDKTCRSTDAEHLQRWANDGNILAELMLENRKAATMKGTFIGEEGKKGLLSKIVRTTDRFGTYDKVTTRLIQTGAITGRLACVASDTVLETTRGNFTIEEYEVQPGDKILTHQGRYRSILRKFVKGIDKMYRVRLSAGQTLHCTTEHRLLTPQGWKSLGELSVGQEIFGVSFEKGSSKYEIGEEGTFSLLEEEVETDNTGHQHGTRDHLPHNDGDHLGERVYREESVREEASILSKQDGAFQSNDWADWEKASRLEGRDIGWKGVPNEEGGKEEVLCASDHNGQGARTESAATTEEVIGASSRRKSTQQRPGQPRCLHSRGAQKVAPQVFRIAEIASLGAMEVYDIEVDEDHSYWAHGFCNHNSRDPNLQNIPNRKDKDPYRMRRAFKARDKMKLIVADYRGAELRVMADLSQDKNMLRAFRKGQDLHSLTAKKIFDLSGTLKEIKENEPDLRNRAKSINFGLQYGMSAWLLAKQIGVTPDEAQEYIDAYFDYYEGVFIWMQRTVEACRRNGYVTTILGRRRTIPEINLVGDANKGRRKHAENQAMNAPIQGSVADMIKVAMNMIENDQELQQHEAELLLQVHDELIVETTEWDAHYVCQRVKEIMEEAGRIVGLKVPMPVDAAIGPSWEEAKA